MLLQIQSKQLIDQHVQPYTKLLVMHEEIAAMRTCSIQTISRGMQLIALMWQARYPATACIQLYGRPYKAIYVRFFVYYLLWIFIQFYREIILLKKLLKSFFLSLLKPILFSQNVARVSVVWCSSPQNLKCTTNQKDWDTKSGIFVHWLCVI